MFQTAVQPETRIDYRSVIGAVAAFLGLLVCGYFLIAG